MAQKFPMLMICCPFKRLLSWSILGMLFWRFLRQILLKFCGLWIFCSVVNATLLLDEMLHDYLNSFSVLNLLFSRLNIIMRPILTFLLFKLTLWKSFFQDDQDKIPFLFMNLTEFDCLLFTKSFFNSSHKSYNSLRLFYHFFWILANS